MMKLAFFAAGIPAIAFVSGLMGMANAGGLLHGLHHRSDCGCEQSAPAVYAAPVVYPELVAAGCCGVGGGLAEIGGLYGATALYDGMVAPGGDFVSGFEGLPNMDGGGVHYRYPYHSYRRPWHHPGPPSTNISIVW